MKGKTPYLRIELSFMECLAFGGLISSTDPVSTLSLFAKLKVDASLFYLILGESLLNDAIGIAVFKTASTYVGRAFQGIDVLYFVLDFFICCVGSLFIGLLGCRVVYLLPIYLTTFIYRLFDGITFGMDVQEDNKS